MENEHDLGYLRLLVAEVLVGYQGTVRPPEDGYDPKNDPKEVFKAALADVFIAPVINFDSAYDTFNKVIGSGTMANNLSDEWRILQMFMLTQMGAQRSKLLKLFVELMAIVINDSPGTLRLNGLTEKVGSGNNTQHLGVATNLSYLLLLVIRVYGPTIALEEKK